jgi:hypothetical protein
MVATLCFLLYFAFKTPAYQSYIVAGIATLLFSGLFMTMKMEAMKTTLEEKQSDLEIKKGELTRLRDESKEANELEVKRVKKTADYLNHLIEVNRLIDFHNGKVKHSIQTIQDTLLVAMELDNVAIWKVNYENDDLDLIGFRSTRNKIINKVIFEPVNLSKTNFLETIVLLESGEILLAPGNQYGIQRLDKQIKQLTCYASMIGCPYFVDEKFSGLIICRALSREWRSEDIIFTKSMAEALGNAFKSRDKEKQQLPSEQKGGMRIAR